MLLVLILQEFITKSQSPRPTNLISLKEKSTKKLGPRNMGGVLIRVEKSSKLSGFYIFRISEHQKSVGLKLPINNITTYVKGSAPSTHNHPPSLLIKQLGWEILTELRTGLAGDYRK